MNMGEEVQEHAVSSRDPMHGSRERAIQNAPRGEKKHIKNMLYLNFPRFIVWNAVRGRMAKPLKAISANRLTDGVVMYLRADGGWTERFQEAAAWDDAAGLEAGLHQAKKDEAANRVVDVAPVDAVRAGEELRPAHLREVIRANGPTVHRDHGKQAHSTSGEPRR
jgi:hypothetical protein